MSKTIIAVTYAMGRTGSSCLMNALYRGGLHAVDTKKPDAHNPRGYFENDRHQEALRNILGPLFELRLPPDIDELFDCSSRNLVQYAEFMEHEYGQVSRFATKAYRALELPILDALEGTYTTRVLVLNRATEDQAQSAARMNDTDPSDYHDRIEAWKSFREAVLERVGLPRQYIEFDELIDRPRQTLERVADFVGDTFDIDASVSAVCRSQPQCQSRTGGIEH